MSNIQLFMTAILAVMILSMSFGQIVQLNRITAATKKIKIDLKSVLNSQNISHPLTPYFPPSYHTCGDTECDN